jgi:hypothetical protein
VQRSPKFRRALLRDAIECPLSGEAGTGQAILRDYIGTVTYGMV